MTLGYSSIIRLELWYSNVVFTQSTASKIFFFLKAGTICLISVILNEWTVRQSVNLAVLTADTLYTVCMTL